MFFWWWTDQVKLNESDSKDGEEQLPDAAKSIVNDMRQAVLRLKGEYMDDDG